MRGRSQGRSPNDPLNPRSATPQTLKADGASPPGRLGRAALILLAAWTILFAPQLFAGRIFVIGDASYLRAFAEVSAERWQARHERTHWNPYIYAGVPSTAALQDSRPQWLPDLLLDGFDALHRIPVFPPLAIPMGIHLAGMICAAALARALWRVGTTAMVWAGLSWGLLPPLLGPFAFGQDALVMAASLMPVLLLAVHGACLATSGRKRLLAGLGLSLTVACVLLAAHPQMAVLGVAFGAGFALERSRAHHRPAALIELGLATILGVAMAAAVWLPAYLYTPFSVRGGESTATALGEAARWSAAVPDILSLAWPWAAGFGGSTYWGGLQNTDFPQYAGLAVMVLSALGLRRRDGAGGAARFLGLVGGAAVLIALGTRLGPMFQVVHAIPLVSGFRVVIRVLIIAQLAMALLSARGLEYLREVSRSDPRATRWSAGVIAVTSLVFSVLLGWGPLAGLYARAALEARPAFSPDSVAAIVRIAAIDFGERGLVLALVLAALALGAKGGGWRLKIGQILSVALLALDLGSVSLPLLRHATGPRESIENPPRPEIARLAAADSSYRALDVSRLRLFSNDWMRWRARSLSGNHPAVARRYDDLARVGLLRNAPVLDALAVGYRGGGIVAPADSSRFERVGRERSGEPVWRARQALPRACAVPGVRRLAGDDAVIRALASPDFDPRRDAYTVDPDIEGEYAAAMRVRWIEDAPDRLVLDTATDSTGFLVIADTWLPGWRARLDGRAWPIHRVQYLLRGIRIPQGTHRLRLDYEPPGWRAGVGGSRAAWLMWIAAILIWIATCAFYSVRSSYMR